MVNSVQGKHVITNIQLSAEADTYSCVPQNKVGPGPTKQLQIKVQGKEHSHLAPFVKTYFKGQMNQNFELSFFLGKFVD